MPASNCGNSSISGCVARFDITALTAQFLCVWTDLSMDDMRRRLKNQSVDCCNHMNSWHLPRATHKCMLIPLMLPTHTCLTAILVWPCPVNTRLAYSLFKEYYRAIVCEARRLITCCLWWYCCRSRLSCVQDFTYARSLLKYTPLFHIQIKPRS
jgi:hypothetical protein